MINLIKALFGIKAKRVQPQRVRNNNGMYARRIKIKEYGEVVGYIYAESKPGLKWVGRN